MNPETSYIFFNSGDSVKSVDRNIVTNVSEYPRSLYSKNPLNSSRCQPFQFECQNNPRDKEIDYFFPTEKKTHPDHFSRFAYPWCENGYCIANHPGRYNTPPGMRWQTSAQPPNMAPEKFYKGKWVDPNYNLSTAYIESYLTRQGV